MSASPICRLRSSKSILPFEISRPTKSLVAVFHLFRSPSSLGPVVNLVFCQYFKTKIKTIKRYHIKGINGPLLISVDIVTFDQETEK